VSMVPSFVPWKKLYGADTAAGDRFGASVALDGQSALVGAPGDDDAGGGSGSAYVFVRAGSIWSQQKKLMAEGGAADDAFGSAVSIAGDRALVGAPKADAAGSNSGAAYTFARMGLSWAGTGKLVPQGITAEARLGGSVALGVDAAVVGAQLDDSKAPNAGAAYVFTPEGAGWVEDTALVANDATTGDSFGFAVAISVDTVVVGAYLDDDEGTNAGSAYTFVVKKDLGDACGSENECASGFCADGVCCDSACAAGACDACSAEGTCTLLDGAPCEGGSCLAGTCIAEADAGADAEADAGADAGADAEADAGANPEADAGANPDEPVQITGGGCTCRTTPGEPASDSTPPWLAVSLLLLGKWLRRLFPLHPAIVRLSLRHALPVEHLEQRDRLSPAEPR
jgi:hypothetical protein